MNPVATLLLHRVGLRLNAAVIILTALMQRTPAVRVLTLGESGIAASPVGVVLRSIFTIGAGLGTVHSLAGATALLASVPSPLSATVGQTIPAVAFTVTNTINIGSWTLGGTLPPGLKLVAQNGMELTGPGVLDATSPGYDDGYGMVSGGVAATLPLLTGTPTQPGSFTLTLQAMQPPGLQGLKSNVFNYVINVAAAAQTGAPPVFSTQPAAQSVVVGGAFTFAATASGTPAPNFQWQKNGTPIPGATNATFTVANAQPSDAGTYTVVATNPNGTVTSTAASLAVNEPAAVNRAPSVARQPATHTVATGSTVVFTADIGGSPAPTYQWRKNSAPINGATRSSLVIAATTAADAGSYSVVATNSQGTVTSTAANLELSNDPNFGHLVNLSIRTTLTASDPKFTVGTVVGGAGTRGLKPLLVRAVGPSLSEFGITTAVTDSKLDVFAGSSVVASNDNWGGDAALGSAFSQVGAFPFSGASSLDAAVYGTSFAARDYTIDISAVGAATGEVIAELYDASAPASFSGSTPRLVNVSVRKQIDANATLTAGFVVGGNTARTVLVRAIGPGLAAFGVTGTMADPQLSLFNGVIPVAANDNWGGDPQLTTAAAAVGAFVIADPASKDAILLITLAPGSYTAEVRGVTGGGGALVEVYEVP